MPNLDLQNQWAALVIAAFWAARSWRNARARERKETVKAEADVEVAKIEAGADPSIVAVLMTRIGELEKRIDALEAKGRVDAHELTQKELAIARKDSLLSEQEEIITTLETANRKLCEAACAALSCDRRIRAVETKV